MIREISLMYLTVTSVLQGVLQPVQGRVHDIAFCENT